MHYRGIHSGGPVHAEIICEFPEFLGHARNYGTMPILAPVFANHIDVQSAIGAIRVSAFLEVVLKL